MPRCRGPVAHDHLVERDGLGEIRHPSESGPLGLGGSDGLGLGESGHLVESGGLGESGCLVESGGLGESGDLGEISVCGGDVTSVRQ